MSLHTNLPTFYIQKKIFEHYINIQNHFKSVRFHIIAITDDEKAIKREEDWFRRSYTYNRDIPFAITG